MNFDQIFKLYKESAINGRYVNNTMILPVLEKIGKTGLLEIASESVLGNPIYNFKIGKGKIKMLIWSQMHGNESTTTKALIDFLRFLSSNSSEAESILQKITFLVIPILNPDGARHYTRENANGVDLNRDFLNVTQPESKLLLSLFENFKPDYCYNLHDQRTIFGVGNSGKPATISFLAPSYNENREMNANRTKAASVIVAMNDALQHVIPGQIGRFDDAFNRNCAGDTFQSFGVPTILFEAGHSADDYDREFTRQCVFIALLTGIMFISENVIVDNRIAEYLNIPQNKTNFYDFVYKNVKINYDGNEIITNFAAQFTEVLEDGVVVFKAEISEIGLDENYFGHQQYDGANELFECEGAHFPRLFQNADFKIGETTFYNGMKVGQN